MVVNQSTQVPAQAPSFILCVSRKPIYLSTLFPHLLNKPNAYYGVRQNQMRSWIPSKVLSALKSSGDSNNYCLLTVKRLLNTVHISAILGLPFAKYIFLLSFSRTFYH